MVKKKGLSKEDVDLWMRYVSSPQALDISRIPRRLTTGQPLFQKLDLHGMTLQQAHTAVIEFIEKHIENGTRSIDIICGKGGRIADELPHWCLSFARVSSCQPIWDSRGEHGAYRVIFRRKR